MELFPKKFLPIGFQSHMRLEMYKLRHGGMFVAVFESTFDEHSAYFPLWTKIDRVDFCVCVESLRDSIIFKVNAYTFVLLSDECHLVANFEKQDRAAQPSSLGKKPIGSSFPRSIFYIL